MKTNSRKKSLVLFMIACFMFVLTSCSDNSTTTEDTTTTTDETTITLTATSQNVSTPYETDLSITLTASGQGTSEVSYTLGTPQNGSLSGTSPNLTYSPNAGFSGSDSFTYYFTADGETSNTATISIEVENADDNIIRVDASNTSGTETGKTWATAYTEVEDALNAAESGDEIWVAKGEYFPTDDNDRTKSFNLVAGVKLYGGFSGNESALTERNFETNATILSGDIGTKNDNTDNSYHVVVGCDDSYIDGFTIQDGYADLNNDGSGSLVETSMGDLEILRIVTDVKSASGGGLLNVHASTVSMNCIFKNNFAAKGGAVYNMVTKTFNPKGESEIGESPYFENCTFEGNSAAGRGGAVNSDFFTTPTYVNCQFLNNHCDSKGGAVYSDMGSPSFFINVLFAGNTAERGAALVADGSSSHRLVYCSFIGNTANDIGAALYQGTYMNQAGINNYFQGNEVHLYHSLLVGNTSQSSSISISNWHDDNVVYDDTSIIEPTDGQYTAVDYADSETYASKNDNYGWKPGRTIDTDSWITIFESDKNSTFVDKTYETETTGSGGTLYVDKDASEGGDGSSWANAYNNLQDALEASETGTQIWVAAGTYKPTTETNRSAAFVMKENVAIYGGFSGNETEIDDRDYSVNITVLSGDIGVEGDYTDDSYHVLIGTSEGSIDGFTIQDGYADGSWSESRGGGLLCYDGASPEINNCIFKNNYAIEGGAITAYNSSAPTINNCTIDSNSAKRAGAILLRCGPDTESTGAKISSTEFSNNYADDRGGAVYIDYGAWPTFTDCTFDLNAASGNGGGVYVDNNSSQLSKIETWFTGCSFTDNVSARRGGAFAVYEGTVHLNSSSITENYAQTGGGGIALNYMGDYDATDTSISSNDSVLGDGNIDDESTNMMGQP